MVLFRLVTFDVTGTLLKFRMSPGEKYAEVAANFGLKVEPRVLTNNFRTHFRDMCRRHPNFGHTTGLGWKKWWTSVVVETFSSSEKQKINEHVLKTIAETLIEDYKSCDCWVVTDGSVSALSRFKESGMHLGVVSNFDSRLENVLESTDLIKYFDFVLGSYAVGHEKPSARIFNSALQSIPGAVQPNQALHVGNDPVLDFQGARNAGWNAVLVREAKEHKVRTNVDIYKLYLICSVGYGGEMWALRKTKKSDGAMWDVAVAKGSKDKLDWQCEK
ncbi:hypothetical protein PR048_020833 [Dryococelus australis]|uniref:Haloacid dehalogenase-like hydrolase domain-containing protein 3 n=1 Tax=Dryococelus australis TaxID=614101 RepID=A0ABQ9GWH7_9NEOP|nr:hypothetical protein PR048_020833 [Dryococelus australis]